VLAHGVLARASHVDPEYDNRTRRSERALQINPIDSEALLTRRRSAVDRPHRRLDRDRRSAMRLNVNIGSRPAKSRLAYLLSQRYADAVRAARSGARTVSDASVARLPAGCRLRRARPNGRRLDGRPSRESARIRISIGELRLGFQDPALQRRVEESLRKAGLN